jgi:hypothetical protein
VREILTAWGSFYAIIGTAAATLTGLMFVVVTFVANIRQRRIGESFAAFATPTVVHFCAALLITAILSAPWPALWGAGLLLGLVGLSGMAYVIVILRRLRRQASYKPVLEDWLWHTIFPLASYTALAIAALILPSQPEPALFIVGAVTVLMLFIGIHNSWDTVTYVADQFLPENKDQD